MLIDGRTGTVCTAFCAGDATIMTSAHCVLGGDDGTGPRLPDLVFRAASAPSRSTTPIAGARRSAGEPNVATGTTVLSLSPPIAATSDWSIVRLEHPVCRGKALALTPRSAEDLEQLSREKRVYNIAFHRDVADWRLAIDPTCQIESAFPQASRAKIAADFDSTDNLVLHTCDTGGASSGSPLLVDGPNGPEVVAMNAGTYVHSTVALADGEVVHRSDAENVANTAVGAGAFAAALVAFDDAAIISTVPGVKELQQLLARAGLFGGPVDGRFGADTRMAIEAFEQREAWPVAGLASTRVLTRLRELDRTRPPPVADTRQSQDPGIETGSVSPPPGESMRIRGEMSP